MSFIRPSSPPLHLCGRVLGGLVLGVICATAVPTGAQPLSTLQLGFARATDQTPQAATEQATADALTNLSIPPISAGLDGRPPALLLFHESLPASPREVLRAVRETAAGKLGAAPAVVAGCSTYGQFTSRGVDRPDADDASVAVGLLHPANMAPQTPPGLDHPVWTAPRNLAASHIVGHDAGAIAASVAQLVLETEADSVLLLVHPNMVYTEGGIDLPGMMAAVQQRVGAQRGLDGPAPVAFFGGITGNRNKPEDRHALYLNDQVYDSGLIAIAAQLGRTRPFDTRHALRPAGDVFTVTRSAGRVVHELDGQPAAEQVRPIFADAFPGERVTHLGVVVGDRLVNMGFSYGHDAAEGALVFSRDMPEGTTVRVLGGDDPSMDPRDTDRKVLRTIRPANDSTAALVFNCVGRQPKTPQMQAQIHDLIADAAGGPVLGFYSGGEIGPVRDAAGFPVAQFHHTTAVAVGMIAPPPAHP